MNLLEIYKSREKTIHISSYDYKEYDYIYGDINVKPGQFFLYEIIDDSNNLHYPKIGIHLNDLPCDQTLEVEWVEHRRNWEWRVEIDVENTDADGVTKKFSNLVGEYPTMMRKLILWDDQIKVYGAWYGLPDWKELKRAYEKTIWFSTTKEEMRERKLKSVLNGKRFED